MKWLCRLLFVFLAIALGACATTESVRKDREPEAVTLAPEQGVVILKAVTNRNFGRLGQKWQQLQIRNAKTGDSFALIDRSPAYALHALYMDAIPAGTYELVKFSTVAGGTMQYFGSAELGPRYGRFEVTRGHVTDLGTLVYLRPYEPINNDRFAIAFAGSPEESAQAVDTLSPAVKAGLNGETLTWLPASASEARPRIEQASLARSMFLNGAHQSRDTSLLFGEALGQVARRDSAGRWSWSHTGLMDTILAVAETSDGTWVAGSEQSLLRIKERGSPAWKSVVLPLRDSAVRFIGEHPRAGVIVVAQDRTGVVVLSTRDLRAPQWKEERRIALAPSWTNTAPTFQAFLVNDRLVVITTVTQWSLKVDLYEWDVTRDAWAERPVAVQSGAFSATANALYTIGGTALSPSLYVTTDYGVTWDKRPAPGWVGAPAFRNANEGYAIRLDNMAMFDPRNTKQSLWKTADGGRNWSEMTSAPLLSQRIVILPENGRMLILTANGRLFASTDGGETWNVERSLE